jgi:hypothetical protein
MNTMARALAVAALLGLYGMAWGAIINVAPSQPDIQAAVDAAKPGDEVVLAPGSYPEGFVVNKAITVRGKNPLDPATVAATSVSDHGFKAYTVTMSGGAVIDGLNLHAADTGVVQSSGSGTVRRCSISGSLYQAVAITGASQLVIEDCDLDCGMEFPAVECRDTCTPTLRNNYFHDTPGGAITCAAGANPRIEGNTFVNIGYVAGHGCLSLYDGDVIGNIFRNCVGAKGGAIAVLGPASIVNNLIVGCVSALCGSAIYCTGPAQLFNNTISDCKVNATTGGSIYVENASPTIRNCIVSFATRNAGLMVSGASSPQITYCDVYGNAGPNYVGIIPAGPGNVSVNPQYVDRIVAVGNYRLRSTGGHYTPNGWVIDTVNSPCLDAGDPTTSALTEPTPNGGRVNMGWDGGTAQASRSAGTGPLPGVTAWTPRGSTFTNTKAVCVSFSVPMSHGSVQANFATLPVKTGTFSWLGRKLTFTPTTPWQVGKRYRITLNAAARSTTGVRLGTPFVWSFSTVAPPAAPAAVTLASAATTTGAQITLSLTTAADVAVTIRNLAGREVAMLTPGQLEQGVHALLWNGKSQSGTRAPAGTYLVEASARGNDGALASAVTTLRR